MSHLFRASRALIALPVSLLMVFLGLPLIAAAQDITGELTVESYVTGHEGQVPSITAGDAFSFTANVQCSDPETGECANAALTFELPEPLEFGEGQFSISPAVAAGSVSGKKLTIVFNGGKLVAGQLVAITVKAVLPSTASANLDGNTVKADIQVTADSADTVSDAVAVTLNIPTVLAAHTTKSVSPTATQPALSGQRVTYTITGSNESNSSVDSLTIAEPTAPSTSTPFTRLAVTDITTLTAPEGADRVAFSWFDGDVWIDGEATAIPEDPSSLLPADPSLIQGMKFTFTKDGGLVPAGSNAATIVIDTATRSGAFDSVATGDTTTIADEATTTVVHNSESDSDAASASVSFTKTAIEVSTVKNIVGSTLIADASTVVAVTATNGIMPISTMRIDEPASGEPDLVAQGLTFAGFVTSGDQKVTWPDGATEAQVTFTYGDDSTETLSTTDVDSLPEPTGSAPVKSFSVTFTGAGDAISSRSEALVAFRVTANAVTEEAGVEATNTISATATNADGSSGSSNATDTVTLLPRRVRTSVSKTFSRSSLWGAPGSAMSVSLTGAVSSSSTIGSDYLTITDDTVDFWDSFNLVGITNTDIPAGSTLTVQYLDAGTSTWLDLATQAGVASNWSYTPTNPDDINGLRFTFTSSTSGAVLPAGFNVAPRFLVKLRPTLRSNPAASTNPDTTRSISDEATSAVHNSMAIAVDATATDSDSVEVKPTGTGSGSPDLIRKYWLTSSGLSTEASTDALSGDTSTARINWDTDGLSMSKMVITDDQRGINGIDDGAIAGSAYDAFDLVEIKPITTSLDPLIGYDKVSQVRLYTSSGWTDITSEACPTASACDGGFPGYTLTAAERASALGVELTFTAGSASTTGAVAIGSDSTPSRGILLTMKLRTTLRSDSGSYVLGTSHSETYNTTSAGVVSNRADAVGTLSSDSSTTYGDAATAEMVIYDRPLNISFTKAFDQSALGLPPAGTAQADYPLITSTLTATNNTATDVPEVTIADPNPAVAGLGAYDYLNLYQVTSTALPNDLEAADVTVELTRYDSSTSTTSTETLSLAATLALGSADLADVVGITVHYGTEANLADPSARLISTEGVAKLALTYQLRATVRSTGEATTTTDQVTNSAVAAIVSPGGMGCTSGDDCDSPTATDTASFRIATPTYAVTAGKSISPASRYEDSTNSYTVTLTGQPSGTARTKLLTLTDATPTFWNAFDLTAIPAVTVPAPVNQLRLSVLTGVGYSFDSAGNVLSYTCGGLSDLANCWHSADWVSAVNNVVSLSLPSGIAYSDVRGVRVDAREFSDGVAVQWERPASPNLRIALTTAQRDYLIYATDGGSTTPVPSTRPGMAGAPGESVQGTTTNTVSVLGEAGWLSQGNTWTATSSASSTTRLQHRVNKITVSKTPGKSSATSAVRSYDLDETIPFKVKVTNSGEWAITGLTLSDTVGTIETSAGSGVYSSGLVEADVSSVFTFTVDGLAVSGFSATLDSSTGALTIGVPDDFVLDPESVLLITANLKFRDYLDVGTVVSNAVTVTSDRAFEECDYTTDGIAQDTLTDVSSCSASTQVRAAASTPMTVTKTVKGVGAGADGVVNTDANYDDLGVIDVGATDATACATAADAEGYYASPCVPITRPGGTERWKLTMTNGGNVAANTVSVIDVLPAVGDTGVTVGTARKSRFNPIFAGNVAWRLPDGSQDYTVTTYYATSTSTSSCYKSDILNDTTPGGVADCGLTWTEFTNADFDDPTGEDAALAASVKAIKIVVSYGAETEGIAAGDDFQATFDTITPAQTSVADATTVEPIAWNSAAVGTRTAAVEATQDTVAYPARASLITEPRKAGVAIASGRINLTKTVSVPAGAAWTDALPTSYTGTLACTTGQEDLTLTGTSTSIDTSAVTLPIPGRTGIGTTVNYNADGSSTLPLYAQCDFTEDTDLFALTNTTSVTAVNDYSGIANVYNGWDGPDTPTLSVTNEYLNGAFTVSKLVSGPQPLDATGSEVAFTDFAFRASCLFNGVEVIPEADRAFTLAKSTDAENPTTKIFDGLPAGATCSVAETYAGGAANTSASIRVTTSTSSYTNGADFSLTAGDATTTQVAFDNSYATGAVTITKTVLDPTGLWGNEDFEARLLCTDPDAAATDSVVYDGTVTLNKTTTSKTIGDLSAGASCTVTETKTGGANTTSITDGTSTSTDPATGVTFTVTDDSVHPTAVDITNTFATGKVAVTKTVQANGAATSAEPWVSGTYPVTLACTRNVNGSDVAITIPDDATRTLTSANSFTTTYSDLPTGATCSVTEASAGSVTGQPDPVVTITDPVTVGKATTSSIGVTNNFRAGKLVITKALTGAGTSFFSGATFEVTCTLDSATVFQAVDVPVSAATLRSAELGPLPFGASCQVSETNTGGADANPGSNTITITQDDASSDVSSLSFENKFSAGTVTISKLLDGDAAAASWATSATFTLAVKCGLAEGGPYSYNGEVLLKGGQSAVLQKDGSDQLFPVGTHCWADETVRRSAVSTTVSAADFDNAVVVTAQSDPTVVQPLAITATNTYTYSGLTITKDVVTTGATDQAGSPLTYNPSFTVDATCTFDGNTVLDDTFVLSGTTSSTGTTEWGSKSYDLLPTGASCTVTEANAAGASSTSITVSRTGSSDATTSGTTATFTLVKGDPANATGDTSANTAAITNTYSIGSATITKALDLSTTGRSDAAKAWAYLPFTVRVTCTADFIDTGESTHTVYDATSTYSWNTGELSSLSASTNTKSSAIANLPTGAACTVTETVNGGANSTSYTNQNFTVTSGNTTATVTNTFTQAAANITKTMMAGTKNVSTSLPWKNASFGMSFSCTRPKGDSTNESFTRSTSITGAGTGSVMLPTGASCTLSETSTTYSPSDTPSQPAATSVVISPSTAQTIGTSAMAFGVTNNFAYGSVTVNKLLDGEAGAITDWAGGSFGFTITCTMPQNGTTTTVYTKTISKARTNSSTTSFSASTTAADPIPVGSTCTVTESNKAGATSSSPASVSISAIAAGTNTAGTFTNTFKYAGFTVTKTVDNGGAKDQSPLDVKYTSAYGFTATCTFNGATIVSSSLRGGSFTLTDGASKTFTNLPVGAQCSVKETDTASAKSTGYAVTQNSGTPVTGTSTTSSTFALVRTTSDTSDPSATVAAFTNHYSTGTLAITKATDGAGAGSWDTGSFTLRATCTLAGATDNAGNSTVYNATSVLTKGQTWTIANLPNRASCTVTEEKDAGANATTVSVAAATIGDGTTVPVTVTNTFHTGTVRVQKALIVNGSATTAEPWASAHYPITLSCTKDFNDDGIAEAITVPEATKTITGAGYVEWSGLPQGAVCAATEGTVSYPTDTPEQPTLTSTSYSDPVTVGDTTTVTQTVTNDFGYGTVRITKQLTGEAAEKWGGAPYTFTVSCTLDGSNGNVFESGPITVQRTGIETTVTSALIGPIPQGSICAVSEIDTGWATSSTAESGADTSSVGTDASGHASATLLPIQAAATRVAGFTNDFEFAGLTVAKSVHTDAVNQAGEPIHYTGSYAFTASCTLGDHEFLSSDQQGFTLTDGSSKTFSELPTGVDCTITETDAKGAASTSVTTARTGHDDVQATGGSTSLNLVAGDESDNTVSFTNGYTTGGLDITKRLAGAGASDWGTGAFGIRTVCTLDADADTSTAEVTVFDDTAAVSADQTWEIRSLPTNAHCSVTEVADSGANATAIDLATPTIGSTNQAVTVTNTFTTGSIAVTKAITANGTDAGALKPWSTGSYPVTLGCTKDFDNDGSAEALNLDAVLGSGYSAKTITGAGTVSWDGLPTGATCTVTEGTTSVTGQPQPSASVGSVGIGDGTTAALTLTNAFAAGKLVIHKDITGAGASTWGTGPFTFDLSCTLTGHGTVFSRTGLTLTPTAGQTSLSSAALGPIPFDSACTVTETDSAGATSASAPVELTISANPDTSDVSTATFTNQFDYAGFTVTKAVTSTARNAAGALVTYKAAAFTASCTFKGAEILTSASDTSFTLSDGGSKTFTNLPTGAVCTVTETNARSATSTDVRIQVGSSDVTTNGTTSSTFTLVSGTATATQVTFTNIYTTGSTTITKATAGTGKDLWGTGVFTVQLICTLSNASNTTVYSATHDLAAGEHWDVSDLVRGASCTVTEPKTGGGNSKTITPSTFTVGASSQAVSVTNTFTLGAVKVTKALTVNGGTTTAAPWIDGSYQVKLACTRSYNGSTVSIDIPDDAYTVGESLDGVRTITGNGDVTYANLPTGASCAATEVSSSPAAQSTAISSAVTVGSNPASPQAITVTNDFHTRTMNIVKQLEGAGQASFGNDPFTFSVACTLPVDGTDTDVFYSSGISVQRSGTATALTSDAIGPIPVGATCKVTETDSGQADFTPDPVTITIGETSTDNLAGLTNQFSAGTVNVTKVLDGAARESSWATGATFGVDVVCQAEIGGSRAQVFSTSIEIAGGQTVNVLDADGNPSRVPLGSHCWAAETNSAGATSSSIDKYDWNSAAVVASGTPQTLQSLDLTVTNTYQYAGFTVTNTVVNGGAKDQNGQAVEHSGTFDYTASCTLNGASVLNESFRLARQVDGSWESRAFTGLPSGASCTVSQTGSAGAASTSHTLTQNGSSGSPASTSSSSFTLVRGSLPWGQDDAGVNVAAFTNSYGVGSLAATKVVTGDGADDWGNSSFDVRVSCTADLDADPATEPSTVFEQTTALSKTDPTWQIDNLVAGASCEVTETAWGGASSHPDAQTASISEGATAAVTISNTFALGSIAVHKSFTVDGSAPEAGWADQLSSASATVELTCTWMVNGEVVPVTVPGGAQRTLNSDNAFAASYSGLPAGAECTVAETASTPVANGTGYSPAATAVVPVGDSAAVEVTNDYHTGTLTIVKEVTGPGVAFGKGPFVFSATCRLPGLSDPVYANESISMTAPNLTSAELGPIPVGASCQVVETDAAGATTAAEAAEVTIPDSPDTDNAVRVTMTNDFGVGTITAAVEVQLDGQVTSASPFAGAKFTLELSCERLVNGSWQSITIPGGASVVVTGAGSHDFSGLPIGARCSLEQTDASLTPRTLSYRTATGAGSGPVVVASSPSTITAIDDFHTEPLVVRKVLAGSGASDFAVHPFTFSIRCTLAESGISEPWLVYSNDAVTLSAASGLTSADLGPIPVGSDCTVTETKSGGANEAARPAELTITDDTANVAELTNSFATGSVTVSKAILVDGEASDAEPYASGVYTVTLTCSQAVDGQATEVTIPGGATREITGSGTAEFASVPLGASCAIAESSSSLAVSSDQITIDNPSFTIGDAPTEVTVTNSFHTSTLRLVANFTGVGADTFADELVAEVNCTLDGASGSVFNTTVTLRPAAGESSASSDLFGPIPVGAQCSVTTVSAHGANALPGTVTVTGEPGQTAVADIEAAYSAGTVSVVKELTGSGASAAQSKTFSIEVTCQRDGVTEASGTLKITGAGTATLADANGDPVLLPAGSACWASETDNGGAYSVTIDHRSPDTATAVAADSPDTLQQLTISVTNRFLTSDQLAYTGYALSWGLPGLGLLSIGLGTWLIRRRNEA